MYHTKYFRNIISVLLFLTGYAVTSQPNPTHDLKFEALASRWDEAIPLGNGMVGALIWQKEDHLRFSLDRADLWDMRPMKGLHRNEFKYSWVHEQVKKDNYEVVQQYFDEPYDREPGPTKIPGAALEFDTRSLGKVESVQLQLSSATCRVIWKDGVSLQTFVHATEPVGFFKFEGVSNSFVPKVIPPQYQGEVKVSGDPVGGDDLSRLGYKQGVISDKRNSITYVQQGWGGFSYQVNVQWRFNKDNILEGVWSISTHHTERKAATRAERVSKQNLNLGFDKKYAGHQDWWKNYWSRSSLTVPDKTIEKQWFLEQYKFGSSSRRGAPPISLQAVWTADNGRIPPWKGDYHHDLNTQLSYWPAYSSNHLEEGLAYLDHLDQNKKNYQRYTQLYFETDGLAVPGVTTLDGTEMGGWIQYSLSPTVSAWLGHHYYMHWRYSMDTVFLKQRAYPWIKETTQFLERITTKGENGFRQLPISSSPEINDNDISAWFQQNTNYDLALMKFTFKAAAELASALALEEESRHWRQVGSEFDDYAISNAGELMVAPTLPYNDSHRHLGHTMAVHPLGLIKWEDGELARRIIKKSIVRTDSVGTSRWVGYSFSWMANLKARAKDGEGAVENLSIFANAFCSPNSFHLNGDQTKSGYSKYTYRPFTLEGNFAFAAGLQEMLIQSYAGFIEVFPAVPNAWKDISFNQLRSEGAFIVSATKENGLVSEVKIYSERGGKTKLKAPFETWKTKAEEDVHVEDIGNGFIALTFNVGGSVVIKNIIQ